MFEVIITSANTNKSWKGRNENDSPFETLDKAQAWLDRQINKNFLPSDYQFQIKDLSSDNEYQLKSTQEKRRKEYPTELEVIEALIEDKEGRPEKLQEVIQKRNAIKIKYPIDEKLRIK